MGQFNLRPLRQRVTLRRKDAVKQTKTNKQRSKIKTAERKNKAKTF